MFLRGQAIVKIWIDYANTRSVLAFNKLLRGEDMQKQGHLEFTKILGRTYREQCGSTVS
jgi:hypothetical protein